MASDNQVQLDSIRKQQAILGGIVWLSKRSDLYLNYPIGHLLQRVVPSIELDQYRYYSDDNDVPMGFVNWALLDEQSLQTACSGDLVFEDYHWQSGENIFITELIAPFGHCRQIVRDLRQNVVPSGARVWAMKGQQSLDSSKNPLKTYRFLNSQF